MDNQSQNSVKIVELPKLEEVYSVINAFYEQNEYKESASKWLEALQESIFAWKIADELLINQLDFNSCYFAAQTLKTKIAKSFNELPASSYDSLKNSIIDCLVKINEKRIQTQLCLALTYILVMNPQWQNPIEELSNKLPRHIFIEMLNLIGEELENGRPSFKKQRDKFEQYLSKHFVNIAQLLQTCIKESVNYDLNNQEQIILNCLGCLESWLTFSNSEHLNVVESMVMIVFSYLKDPNCSLNIHERASDALCKIICLCEERSYYNDLRLVVMENVFDLKSSYNDAVINEDSGKLMDLTKIFVEMGKTLVEFIIFEQVDKKIMDIILNCVTYYEFEVAEITFNFWYHFSESLRKRDFSKYASYYNSLVSSLTRHSQMEADFEGLLDEKSDLNDYRTQISELIEDIIMCFDWVNYVKTMNVVNYFNSGTSWEVVESHLFILYCMACDSEAFIYNPSINDVMPGIVNYILNLPNNLNPIHVQVYATACDLLGLIHKWINGSNFIQPVVSFLLDIFVKNYIKVPKLAIKAAISLKLILTDKNCNIDQQLLSKLFVDLVNIYFQIEDRVDLGVPILACCTAILSNKNIENFDQQEVFFIQMLQLCLNKINNILNAKVSIEEQKKRWEKIIDNIHAVFKDFRANEHTKKSTVIHNSIRDNIWPFLKESITHFAPIDSQVIEHCSRCIRHIVRSMKPSYLLQPIVDHIVPLYQVYPSNSSLVYIGSVLVDEFANKDDLIMAEGLLRMMNTFSSVIFCYITQENVTQNIYVIDDYFTLCTRVMNKLTDRFLSNNEILNGILALLIMSIYVPEKDTNDSIIKFLTEFVNNDHPIKAQYISNEIGRNIFYAVIDSIMFKLPGYFIPDMINAIWAYKICFPNLFNQYLLYTVENIYQKVQNDGHNVSQENLKEFYEGLQKATNPKPMVSQIRHLQRLINS